MILKWILPAFVALGPLDVAAQDNAQSGNYYLPGCQAFVAASLGGQQTTFRAGACLGPCLCFGGL